MQSLLTAFFVKNTYLNVFSKLTYIYINLIGREQYGKNQMDI